MPDDAGQPAAHKKVVNLSATRIERDEVAALGRAELRSTGSQALVLLREAMTARNEGRPTIRTFTDDRVTTDETVPPISVRLPEADHAALRRLATHDVRPLNAEGLVLLREALVARRLRARPDTPRVEDAEGWPTESTSARPERP